MNYNIKGVGLLVRHYVATSPFWHVKSFQGPWTVFSKCVIILACDNIILSFSKNLS